MNQLTLKSFMIHTGYHCQTKVCMMVSLLLVLISSLFLYFLDHNSNQ